VIETHLHADFVSGHRELAERTGATPLPLDRLDAGSARLDAARPMTLICGSGYRSSTATSLLRRQGFDGLHNVVGGTAAWTHAGYPVERG